MTCHWRSLDGGRELLTAAAVFPERYPCLLQSVMCGIAPSRYAILFAFPENRLVLAADRVVRKGAGRAQPGRFPEVIEGTWEAARRTLRDVGLPRACCAIVMTG